MLRPTLGDSARRRICERAYAELIRARAELFVEGSRRYRNHDIPAEFWWAKGREALEQDWSAGDFSTWIDRKVELKAFGVTFAQADIEKIVPASDAAKKETQAAPPSGTAQNRRLTTIVALDVVGYSAGTQADEPKMTGDIARKYGDMIHIPRHSSTDCRCRPESCARGAVLMRSSPTRILLGIVLWLGGPANAYHDNFELRV